MQISVSGEERRQIDPERAEVHLTVSREGADRARVVGDATALANALAAELAELQQAGAVTRHVVQPLHTSVWRRTRRSAEEFTASVDLTATFADFEELGRRTGDWATREGVRLGWVRWFVTRETTRRITDECIAGAVERARERAGAMARAAGAGELEIVEIADPGLLGTPESTMHFAAAPRMMAMARSAGAADEEPVRIEPEPVEIAVTLQLRFASR